MKKQRVQFEDIIQVMFTPTKEESKKGDKSKRKNHRVC